MNSMGQSISLYLTGVQFKVGPKSEINGCDGGYAQYCDGGYAQGYDRDDEKGCHRGYE